MIYKEAQQYIRTLRFQYIGTHKFGNQHLDKVLNEMKNEMPIGYKTKKIEQQFLFFMKETKKHYHLIGIVLLIIYFLCAILFESFRQPIAVIAVVPVSFIGVFLTFYIYDINFDQGGFAAFILLSGLTVNSAIYIINDYNVHSKKNRHLNISQIRLYLKAFNSKIIPAILTILSTILGFIPFLPGGQTEVFWYSLAAGTIGGLLFSLLAIYFYLPLFMLSKP